MTAREALEIRQIEADIALKEAQMEKAKQDWRLDPQRVVIQAVLATAAIIGAIVGVAGTYLGWLLRGQVGH